MGSSPMSPTDRARAIKLYELGHSWPDVAAIMGRNAQALHRSLGKWAKRDRREVMRLAWKKKYWPGPRMLDGEEERRLYKKMRSFMSADLAVKSVTRMREF